MRERAGIAALCALVAVGAGCPGCLDEAGFFAPLETALSVRPERVQIERLWAGIPREVSVVAENRGRAPLSLVRVRVEGVSGPGELSATALGDGLPPGGSVEIRLLATGVAGASGALVGTLVVSAEEHEVEVPIAAMVVPVPSCDDGNPCTVDRFDPVGGVCAREALPDFSSCDDDNACTEGDQCLRGECSGRAIVCDDGVGCTMDRCEPSAGCVFEPAHDRCDDDDGCTDDVCSPASGCENPPRPTGSVCHQDGCAEIGFCVEGSCVVQDVPDGIPCEDGDPCTRGDTCQGGTCTPGEEGSVGAPPPALVSTGEVSLSFCGGPEPSIAGCLDDVTTAGIDELLAVRRAGDFVEVVWRTRFVDVVGAPCDPHDPMYHVEWLDPAHGEDNAGARAPPAGPVCAAGVFATRASWGVATAAVTTQLTVVRGPVAAAFEDGPDDGVGLGGVALAHARYDGQSVWLERKRVDGTSLVGPRSAPFPLASVEDRLMGLAVALSPGRAVVVGHGYLRGESVADCAFPGCASGARLGVVSFYEGPAAATFEPGAILLEEVYDESCEGGPAGPLPLVVRDLEAHPRDDGQVTVGLRMRRSACGDLPLDEAPPLYPYVVTFDPSVPGGEVHPAYAGLALGESVEVAAAAVDGGGALALRVYELYLSSVGCPEGWSCECQDAEGLNCVASYLALDDGTGLRVMGDAGLGAAFARPLRADGRTRVAVRVGAQLSLAWWEDGVQRLPAPAVEGWGWGGRLIAGPDAVVASRAARSGADPCPDGPTCPSPPVLVQSFGCRFPGEEGPGEVPCLEDADCGEGFFCERDGVCCEPVCYGACVPSETPTDAGIVDAGVPDAGDTDAGEPDAGYADAGVLPDAAEPDAGIDGGA